MRAQLGVARIATIKFATAEWINLSPELVNGLEESLRELAPGETLASALPPPPSASSWLGLPAPSMSHNSSAGSGVPRPTLPASAGGRGDQVARSLPRVRLLETPQPSPISAAPPPAVAAAVRRTSFVSDPGERPVDWVTVRYLPRDFPFFTDNLPPTTRLVRALPVAAYALCPLLGHQTLHLLLFLSERWGRVRFCT